MPSKRRSGRLKFCAAFHPGFRTSRTSCINCAALIVSCKISCGALLRPDDKTDGLRQTLLDAGVKTAMRWPPSSRIDQVLQKHGAC